MQEKASKMDKSTNAPGSRLVTFERFNVQNETGLYGHCRIVNYRPRLNRWIFERKFYLFKIEIDKVQSHELDVVRLRMEDRITGSVYNATWLLRGSYHYCSLDFEISIVIANTYAACCIARSEEPIPRNSLVYNDKFSD